MHREKIVTLFLDFAKLIEIMHPIFYKPHAQHGDDDDILIQIFWVTTAIGIKIATH